MTFNVIALFEAERHWAYAMELKKDSQTEPRKRHHLKRKMKRAVDAATFFEKISKESTITDANFKLHAQAYAFWMRGNASVEEKQWQKGREFYMTAKTIYEALKVSSSNDQLLCLEKRLEEMEPLIRLCVYQLNKSETDLNQLVDAEMSLENGLIDDQVQQLILESQNAANENVYSFSFANKNFTTREQKTIKYLAAGDLIVKDIENVPHNEAKLKLFDLLISNYLDGIKVSSGDSKTFLLFKKAIASISRCLTLAKSRESNCKWKEIVRLMDISIQNLEEIKGLDYIKNDPLMFDATDAKIFQFKANRCYAIAQFYSSQESYREAMAMLERAENHFKAGHNKILPIDQLFPGLEDRIQSELLKCNVKFQIAEEKKNQLVTSSIDDLSLSDDGSPKTTWTNTWKKLTQNIFKSLNSLHLYSLFLASRSYTTLL
ncbi:hypothetical protein ROZALSC1DRAFT_22144 [Rozella allomycis CSF55]|uniref:Signal recognition particle subunit SRP68 n=1 Tax=Rozella allomycis (strain CSF55) TaxID=988480 RepID=A0A4P9YJL8_ROZAC|nr:hypothetical protein ROZALSC1DRAFT_22144 [Rozella allomycis CSF55]